MDVLDASGVKLSRKRERGCLVCGAPGRACAAGRLHPLEELVRVTGGIISDYLTDIDSSLIANLARESLIDEVSTTPKPGLVDREGCGSHTDMGLDEFVRSADALTPYFKDCTATGISGAALPRCELFAKIRARGIKAEAEMYAATGGVNTHKGIIFSMGILATAAGRLMGTDGRIPSTDDILTEAARIAEDGVSRDLESMSRSTAGGRAYLEEGERGIRGEVLDGFPSVKNIALPIYKKYLKDGKSKNDAGALTLLHLIANIYDTSIYNRGGSAGVAYAKERARALLSAGEPSMSDLRALGEDFTRRRLSPGGSADLLAITYFLSSLEE
jgi:holo-ACP synthase/triphosphoribosyl-dephospho-CoA synthase